MSDTTVQDEYQEQVIENLEDISDSVSDEKKFRQEVLTEIKSVKKSVDALQEDDYILLTPTLKGYNYKITIKNVDNSSFSLSNASNHNVYTFGVGNIENFYIKYNGSGSNDCNCILTSSNVSAGGTYPCNYFNSFPIETFNNDYKFINYTNSKFFIISFNRNSISIDDIEVYYLKSENPNSDSNITVETIDYTDGINNITEILTFQSFATALVLGILLFLIFIKGLRK